MAIWQNEEPELYTHRAALTHRGTPTFRHIILPSSLTMMMMPCTPCTVMTPLSGGPQHFDKLR